MAKSKRATPEISQIFNLLEPSPSLGFIRGHLVVEGILIEALRARLCHPAAIQLEDMNYARAVGLCRALEMIDEKMFGLLKRIGRIRNQMAHELSYDLTFSEAFSLADFAAKSGVDFSDDTIHLDEVGSRNHYDLEGIIQELFQNLAQDLVFLFDPDLDGPFSEFFSP